MIGMLATFVPPWLAAYAVVRWAWPLPPTPWRTLFRFSLATGLALGLSSLTFFLWAVCADPRRPGLLAAELVGFGLLAFLFWRAGGVSPLFVRNRGLTPPARQATDAPHSRIPRLALGFVLLCALGVVGWDFWHDPHGDWDAWAIWNLRARFLYRGGEHWTAAFSPLLEWTHPDYPLLVPAAVARGWSYAGRETTLVPRLIAGLFGAATVGLLMSVLALLRGPSQGCLAGVMLLATPYFLELTTAQYADVPLGFFFLASAALFEIHDRGGTTPRLPLLAGTLTGLAAWTKNEGLLFLVAAALARVPVALARKKVSGTFSAPKRFLTPFWTAMAFPLGVLPVFLVLIYFKLRLAPANDLVAGQSWQATRDRLIDGQRYTLIADYFLQALAGIGPGAVVVLAGYRWLLGRPPRSLDQPRPIHASAVLVLMLAGYAVVYVTTPNPLAGHLHYSVHRLFMQMWPTVLLAFFLATATPKEARRPFAS